MEMTLTLFVVVAVVALFCGYVSISIGMGYGTTLAPLLLIVGFSPFQVIPAVLSSQLVGGMIGGLAHHRFGNIKLDFRQDEAIKTRLHRLGYIPRSVDSKVVFTLAATTSIGSVIAAPFAAMTVKKVNTNKLRLIIGMVTCLLGSLTLVKTFIF